ncbi:WhiB family transcriptional regulator [Streptomyces sp. NPDC007074]|uniref:WhiB family transcriptional regulator n=1 Tax=Streptomyces sp. NPDC007074 TaxID=3156764 RepID=UPI0033D07D2C
MTTTTGRATTGAALPAGWRTSSACQGIDTDTLFSDNARIQTKVQGICRGCRVRTTCLTDITSYEQDGYMVWGVAGGLTTVQRRALRVERLLGNVPNLEQARLLASPKWAGLMAGMRDWPAAAVAAELRKRQVLVTPVTVRLALWWTGGNGGVLLPKQDGDRRHTWERVRDESQDTVDRLRELGLGNRDVAAYLMVSEDALSRAITVWRANAGTAVAA